MRNYFTSILFLTGLISFLHQGGLRAQVRLPRLVSDGMILQRDTLVRIWGWAAPEEKITIDFNHHSYYTRADKDGNWAVLLSPLKAGGPYRMQIDASNHLVVEDILVGEVWVCSGQSNMVLPMERVKFRYPDEIARSTNQYIRQFLVPNDYDFARPRQDLSSGKWESADPQTVLHFSATAYFFARALFDKYHVPIGLINASVGGAPAEAWLSNETLPSFPGPWSTLQKYRKPGYMDSISRHETSLSREWYTILWSRDTGLHGEKKWYDTGYDAGSWQSMHVPGLWAKDIEQPVNGVMWFRRTVEVPPGMTGKPARLLLGRIIDRDSVYVNGVFVGTTGYQYPPRNYELPANLLRPGKNLIVVRIINSAGRGGFAKGKTYSLTAVGDSISLEGEWQYKLGATMNPLAPQTFFQYQPEGLYNGMISPISPFSIRGVIWYQGEGNLYNPGVYKACLEALILDWRKAWKQGDFPFLYVQLPNYQEHPEPSAESAWPVLREQQRQALEMKNTGMAVAIDIGEWNDLHPLNKKDVGERLALLAMHLAYGDDSEGWSGPMYSGMNREGNRILLSFSQTGKGLVVKKGGLLSGFTIAGTDRKFMNAHAQIIGDKVAVWNDSLQEPAAVRYGWADNPEGANLYNQAGLPASPFTTDH